MPKITRSRRTQCQRTASIAIVGELVEPRQLLSAMTGESPSTLRESRVTREVDVEAHYRASSGGHSLRIDEIRFVGDEIRVYSTTTTPSLDSIVTYGFVSHREKVKVTVPDREFTISYFYQDLNTPQRDLYFLREAGNSTLLYRNPEADHLSAWPIDDVSPGAGSTVELNLTEPPETPTGFVFRQSVDQGEQVTIYFDERLQFSADASHRHMRRYQISPAETGRPPFQLLSQLEVVMMDDSFESFTDSRGVTRLFGGKLTLQLPAGVYDCTVRLQEVPIFPGDAANTNALASEWSGSFGNQITILPRGQDILLTHVDPQGYSGRPSVRWGPVADAISYDMWIGRPGGGHAVFQKSGLLQTLYSTERPLDTGTYQVWVRAVREDGSRTAWSQPLTVTIPRPVVSVESVESTIDRTPTIRWQISPPASSVEIRVIDEAKEVDARRIRFSSEADRLAYITAYSAQVSGDVTEHEVQSSLAPGKYRILILAQFANRVMASGSASLTVIEGKMPPIILRAGLINDSNVPGWPYIPVTWDLHENADSYDIWVAYLGSNPHQRTFNRAEGLWAHTRLEGVRSGSYEIPFDAMAGAYRIWVRSRHTENGISVIDPWSESIHVANPFRTVADGETVRWNPFRGAAAYEVTFYRSRPPLPDGRSLPQDFFKYRVETGTSFMIPIALDDSEFGVVLKALNAEGRAIGFASGSQVTHGTTPWAWNIHNDARTISWDAVPGASNYEIEVRDFYSSLVVLQTEIVEATTASLPQNLPSGRYVVKLRAWRTVGTNQFWSEWSERTIAHGVETPSGITVAANQITWNAQPGAEFRVVLEVSGAYFDGPEQYEIDPSTQLHRKVTGPFPDRGGQYHRLMVTGGDTNTLDLKRLPGLVHATGGKVTLKVSIRASRPFGLVSDWSTPVEFTPDVFPTRPIPVFVRTDRPTPTAPNAQFMNSRDIRFVTDSNARGGIAFWKTYRAANRVDIDLETAYRFRFRVTDLVTGTIRVSDESESALQFEDSPYDHEEGTVSVFDISEPSVVARVPKSLIPASGVYKVEVSVQYLPIVLKRDPSTDGRYGPGQGRTLSFANAQIEPDRINVAVTPWSSWSNQLDLTILPPGQNILPAQRLAETTNPRPTFQWGSNTPQAQHELWVENETTRQRVIHQTLSDVRQFTPTSDLPAGKYNWWVRIVGTEGPRKGWSVKQSLEIFAAALQANMNSESVDSTPVVSWTAAAGARSYEVQFRSVTTGHVVYTATEAASRTSHRVATVLPNDTYEVSIQASLPHGARAAPGPANAEGKLVPFRMIVGAAPRNVILSTSHVAWQAVSDATRYQVWISFVSASSQTERILREDVFATSLTLSSSLMQRPGEYRVWLRAIRSEGGHESIGRWSEQQSLFISQLTSAPKQTPVSETGIEAVMMALATSGLLDAGA